MTSFDASLAIQSSAPTGSLSNIIWFDTVNLIFKYNTGAGWIPLSGAVQVEQTTTSTGTQNDFDLNGHNVLLRCNNASLLTLTGFTVNGATPLHGSQVTIVGINAQVNFSHQAGSTAANQLFNFITSGPTPILLGSVKYIYDGTTSRWRLVDHEQGKWISIAFAAGDFTASGSMTWTVASGDQVTRKFYIKGRCVTYNALINTSTVGGVVSTELRVAFPGYTMVDTMRCPCSISDNGVQAIGVADSVASASHIRVLKVASVVWTLSTDLTFVWFTNTFEVS